MKFRETPLKGAYVIELEQKTDERGYFARSWCARELEEHGLETRLAQCNISHNHLRGTLRGMHYQLPPHAETKFVRCTRGALYDVIIDLRPDSPTFLGWYGETLTPENGHMMYIPRGFAHGFLTLSPDTDIFYHMSEFYAPGAGRAVRWNDPMFAIDWPDDVRVISERDRDLPNSSPDRFQREQHA
jgi:dTDP-4-dehydrorhamnose 3,5-epimerase